MGCYERETSFAITVVAENVVDLTKSNVTVNVPDDLRLLVTHTLPLCLTCCPKIQIVCSEQRKTQQDTTLNPTTTRKSYSDAEGNCKQKKKEALKPAEFCDNLLSQFCNLFFWATYLFYKNGAAPYLSTDYKASKHSFQAAFYATSAGLIF